MLEDTYEDGPSALKEREQDPNNDTQTSDFYQIPIQGGIPVQLTIENGRRPFTPPFAQLVKVKPPTGQSGKAQAQATPATPAEQRPPEFVAPTTRSVLTEAQRRQLKQDILVIHDNEEEPIEEEIEDANEESPATVKQDSTPSK